MSIKHRKRLRPISILVLVIVFVVSFAVVIPAVAQGELLWLNPAAVDIGPGGSANVDIQLDNILNVFGVQLSLSFEPGVLEVVGAQVTPGTCPEPDFILQNTADNVLGTINYAVTSLAPTPPCDGGVVATIEFQCASMGTVSVVNFTESIISDNDGFPIPHTTQSTTVTCVAPTSTVGLYDNVAGYFYLRNTHAGGPADEIFGYGPKNEPWSPIAGDWDNNGIDTVGLYNPVSGYFYLRNAHAGGAADETFGFGPKDMGWVPITGDWDNDGMDTVGLYDPVGGRFYLRNAHAGGAADESFSFGPKDMGWVPLAGDWDGDGVDTVGLYDPVGGTFYLRNAHAGGAADETFQFGKKNEGWVPIAGDWDADVMDTIGMYDPVGGNFYLNNTHTGGAADEAFRFGPMDAGWKPIAGDWDGL